MSRILLVGCMMAAAACTPSRSAPPAAPAGGIAIHDVTVVDVERGALRPGQTVVVQGNRIAAVGPSARMQAPTGAIEIDGAGRYLMPGLWDMHTHLNGSAADSTYLLPTYVANGVTGIRELWSDPPGVFDDSARGITLLQSFQRMREHVRSGRLAGPRMLLSTAPIDGPFGPDGGTHVIRDAGQAREVVARGAAAGVDIVGIYRWVDPAFYGAAANTAREQRLPLAGGMPIAATFAEAAAAGHLVRDGVLEWELACSTIGDSVRSVLREAAQRDVRAAPADSAASMYRTFMAARPRLRETFDAARCTAAARTAARDGIWQMPRLLYGKPVVSAGRHGATAASYLPRDERAAWSGRVAQVTRDSTGRIGVQATHERRIFRILHDAGIPFLVGTESYFGSPAAWGFSVHDELVELVGIGLSPAEALRAATLEPARAMGMTDSLGSIAPGKLADLVLLEADPLADIGNAARIQAVIANGVLHDRAALDRLLAGARSAAAAQTAVADEVARAPYDVVIIGGRVIDPESGLDAVRNIGINGGTVQAITEATIDGRTHIDARGRVVAPGFIDLHQHAHASEALRAKVLDGVTAAFEMEMGVPDIDAWYGELEGKAAIHFGAAAGHMYHRVAVLTGMPASWDFPSGAGTTRAATPAEIDSIRARIERELRRGAVGVGMGIEYTPGATPWEVLEVFRGAARFPGAPVHVHVRGTEPPHHWMETAELILATVVTGVPLQIVHVNSSFGSDAPRLFEMIAAARARGLDVTADAYPYTASMTSIRAAPFDDWEQWPDERFARFVWPPTGERLTRESFGRYRATGGVVVIEGMTEERLRPSLASPIPMIASDGVMAGGSSHPRIAGTYARVLGRYVREQQVLTLTDALRKMTLLPAQRLEGRAPAMRRKGRIRVGSDADITVFDPETVIDRATYREPLLPSRGIVHVLVSGVPVVRNGQLVEGVLPGTPIRGPVER